MNKTCSGIGPEERESLDQIFKMLMRKDRNNQKVRSNKRTSCDIIARFYDGETEHYF
jgi:hypothetical protein